MFNLNTTLKNGMSNINVTLIVNVIAATAAQIAASKTPPKLSAALLIPTALPCFSSNAALRWNYTFPKVENSQNDKITFGFACKSANSTSIFMATVNQDIMTLNLNSAVSSN